MSPRAAWRLESLGYAPVYDYAPGKTDWLAAGLPREGQQAAIPLAGDIAHEVPTCHFREKLADVRAAVPGDDGCVVINDGGIVLGVLRPEQLDRPAGAGQRGEALVEEVMRPGPSTVRASVPVVDLIARLRESPARPILVTTPEGHLLGGVKREAAERALEQAAAQMSQVPPAR